MNTTRTVAVLAAMLCVGMGLLYCLAVGIQSAARLLNH